MKTYHFCVIARRVQFFAPDAAIFNGTRRHPGTKFGEPARSGMRPTCTPLPCTSCLVFPYLALGFYASNFKIATAALRPRNDTKSKRFIWKTNFFGRIQLFSIGINVRFSGKTYRFCHCEERSDAAIFKPKAWHPVAKHGIGKRQNSQILIRPAGTPHRRSVGSAISRGRKPAFHMRQHISHDQRSYFTAQPYSANGRISLRSLAAASRSIFPLRPLPLRAILTVRLGEIFCLLSDILAFPVSL